MTRNGRFEATVRLADEPHDLLLALVERGHLETVRPGARKIRKRSLLRSRASDVHLDDLNLARAATAVQGLVHDVERKAGGGKTDGEWVSHPPRTCSHGVG